MAVYVDPAVHPFGRMIMCHMWADSLEELLAMVDRIGVQRKWIQGHPTLSWGKHRLASWVHFDIAKEKRALAVAAGAIETDKFGPLEWKARQQLVSDEPRIVAVGRNRLKSVEACRAIRAGTTSERIAARAD